MSDEAAIATVVRPVSNHRETQRNLQQASEVLEAAYRRIREVRRNLLEAAGSFSIPDSQQHGSGSRSIGPGHEAITLVDSLADTPTILEGNGLDIPLETISLTIEERLRQIEARIELGSRLADRYRELPSIETSRQAHLTPPSADSPNITHRSHLPQNSHSQIETRRSGLREAYADDGTTSIGRRVAAREAAGTSNLELTTSSGLSNSMPRGDRNLTVFTSFDRDIAHFRSLAQQRRTEPVLSTSSDARLQDVTRTARTIDTAMLRRDTHVPNPFTGLSPPLSQSNSHRQRLGMLSSRSPVSNQPERLSLLSNISVQNLATPTSSGTRPLLFDEPSSYVPAASSSQYTYTRDESAGDSDRERSYIIRRRFRADGAEYVHPVNLEWVDEEASSWLSSRSSQDDPTYDYPILQHGGTRHNQQRDTATESIQATQPRDILPQRRRGWARLDPDGDEIPADEEEELERIRAEDRIQAQSRPRVAIPDSTIDDNIISDPRPPYVPIISTSITPSNGSDTIHRVRLSTRDSRLFPNVPGSATTADPFHKTMSTSAQLLPACSLMSPSCVNPLPMPLEEMVWSPPKVSPPHSAKVPKYASLAGR